MKPRTFSILKLLALTFVCCFRASAQTTPTNENVEIPFDFYHNAIIVQAKVNDKGPYNMMLDTGVNPSVIDLNTAKEIGLSLASVGQPGAGGGTSMSVAYETILPLLTLDGLKAKNVAALGIDLSRASEALGRPIHGVLGYSLLQNRIVQIDYPKRVVRFYPKSPFSWTVKQANSAERTVLSFRYHDDILVEGVRVNGKKIVANLDTGSNSNFQLTPAAVVELGLEAEVGQARTSESVGFNGVSENREGRIENITVGGINVHQPTVIFFGKGTGHDQQAWGLNIGNAFLKDFVVTIDYRKKTIMLERH